MQDSFPETLPSLNASVLPGPVLVYGLGRSGRGVLKFLARHGISAHWHDMRPGPEDLELSERLGFTRLDTQPADTRAEPFATVIAAPGVPIDHPDLLALARQGAEIIGEVELAYRFFPDLPMVGITGTAGKGSTTVLITELLRALGYAAREGGNIDPPLLDVIDEAEVAVIELSSFQLERVRQFRPRVAVITNLEVDHIDRHGSVAAYHAAKLNITRAQRAGDVLLTPPLGAMPLLESPLAAQLAASKAAHWTFDPQHVALEGEPTDLLDIAALPAGVHPANAAAAVKAVQALVQSLGKPLQAAERGKIAQALTQAKPVKGRFETVARVGELSFINDSIATRTVAVKAALLQAKPPIVWLVGGRDKGAEFAPLLEAARGRVAKVIAFGEDGPRFAAELGSGELGLAADIIPHQAGIDSMPQVVAAAVAALQALAPAGEAVRGTVLLAPVGTSFDAYKDYAQRGQAFEHAVQAWLQGKRP